MIERGLMRNVNSFVCFLGVIPQPAKDKAKAKAKDKDKTTKKTKTKMHFGDKYQLCCFLEPCFPWKQTQAKGQVANCPVVFLSYFLLWIYYEKADKYKKSKRANKSTAWRSSSWQRCRGHYW